MKVVTLNLEQLTVAYHPRKILGNLQSLQESIRRDGLNDPILVYPFNEGRYAVIDGNRRLAAVREFGWQTVPCIVKEIGTVDAAHLSYVKNSERAPFNAIETALHIKTMRDDFGFTLGDLELKGYGSKAHISSMLKLLALPKSIQERIQNGDLSASHGVALARLPNDKARIKMAQRVVDFDFSVKRLNNQIDDFLKRSNKEPPKKVTLPSIGIPGVRIKDSRDMSELPDGSIHLIVTSPPYGIGMEYEKGVTYQEHLDMVAGVLKECGRVLVPGGIMALNVGDILKFKGPQGKNDFVQIELMGNRYQSMLRKHGIYLTDQITWQKSKSWVHRPDLSLTEKTVHTTYGLLNTHEPIYIFRKKGDRDIPPEDIVLHSKLTKEQWSAWIPDVWHIDPVMNPEGHPCPYPDELVRRLVLMFSYVGDTVLDPFLGSGTTVKVARELGREAVGYERDLRYKDVIMRKLGIKPEPEAEDPVEVMKANIGDLLQDAQEQGESVGVACAMAAPRREVPAPVGV